ncbi:hypothetical protein Tco_0266504 [Tanacetum coccineum]
MVQEEIECDGQDVKKDVKDEIEIARAALIQQESWDDLNSEGDVAEGVPSVGGNGSNSLKTVDRISKSDELSENYKRLRIGSDDVVHGFKDVKSLSFKRISVCNIVSDNDDSVADGNNSKVGKFTNVQLRLILEAIEVISSQELIELSSSDLEALEAIRTGFLLHSLRKSGLGSETTKKSKVSILYVHIA